MAEDPATFKVWIAMLAACKASGIADVSSVFLSSVCHLSLETIDKALSILSSPDSRSRSDTEEGRRITKVDGGYFIVNYEKYRAFTVTGDPNSPGAIRTRRWREKRHASDRVTSHGCRDVTSASASTSTSSSSSSKQSKEVNNLFEQFWTGYPKEGREKKKYCRAKFATICKQGKYEALKKTTIGYLNVLEHKEKKEGFKQRPMNCATWLNNWEEDQPRYVDKDGKPFEYEPEL